MKNKKLGWLGIARLQDYVNIVTSRTGLTIKYDDKCTRSYTDGNTLVIPRVHSKLTDAMVDQIKYDVLTETLRQTEGTDFRYINATKIDNTHPLGYTFNVLEANRIERQGASKFKGDAKTLDKAYMPRVDEQLKMIEKSLAANPSMLEGDSGTTAMLSSILIDNMAREDWVSGAIEYTPKLQHALEGASASLKEFIATKAESLAKELNAVETTAQAYALAKKLYDESNPPPEPEPDGSEGESESAKAEAEMQAAKEAKDKPAAGKGKGEGEGTEGEGKDGEPADGKLKERPKYEWEQSFKHTENPKGHGMGLDYSNWSHNPRHTYNVTTDSIILDYVRGRLDGVPPRNKRNISALLDVNDQQYGSAVQKLDSKASRSFPNKVRRLLQIQMASRTVHAQPKGRKLDRKNLIRLPMGKGRPEMDDYSKRIFSNKENQLDLDVACTVLCDFSGSMCGSKTTSAANALMLLNNVMGTSLKLPLEILTFTEHQADLGLGDRRGEHVPLIGLYKYFDRPVTEHALYSRLRKAAECQGQNGDADAISIAYHRLMKRPEKLKVLIVLSDGSPASSKHGDSMSATKNVVGEIEKEGRVKIVGLGIQDDNVTMIYKNNEVMWDSSQLETVLLKTLSNYLFKN